MKFRTVFIENQCRCSYKTGYLVVRSESGTTKIHLSEISSILLETNQMYISAYLLQEIAKMNIPLIVSDEKHNPVGEFLPLYGSFHNSKRITQQLSWTEPQKKRVWQRIIKEKISKQGDIIKLYNNNKAVKFYDLSKRVKSGDTTNCEAIASRDYFLLLFGSEFNRNIDCPINASLNYGYAVLLSLINREITSKGYLTQLGIFHRNEYNYFNLSCDFMEPFRPVVDFIVLKYLDSDFDRELKLRLANFDSFNLEYNNGIYKAKSVISLYVQDCINALNKEIDINEIKGYKFCETD